MWLFIYKIAGENDAKTAITGVVVGVDVSAADKVWRVFQAIGNIASAYFYSTVLIEIQVSQTLPKTLFRYYND